MERRDSIFQGERLSPMVFFEFHKHYLYRSDQKIGHLSYQETKHIAEDRNLFTWCLP